MAFLRAKGVGINEIKYTFPIVKKDDYKRAMVLRVDKSPDGDGVILLAAYFR